MIFMKKTYIIPEVEIHAISVEGLIATSDPNVKISTTSGSINAGEVGAKGNTQSYDVWDDDWSR